MLFQCVITDHSYRPYTMFWNCSVLQLIYIYG